MSSSATRVRRLHLAAKFALVFLLVVGSYLAGRVSHQREAERAPRADAMAARKQAANAKEELKRTTEQYDNMLQWERIRWGEEADRMERDKRFLEQTDVVPLRDQRR